MKSYAVRCIFEAPVESINTKRFLYEERITIWRALNIDDAIDRAEEEANSYCRKNVGFRFSGLSQAFWMFQSLDGNGVEVFSLLRESDLEMDEYLDRFFSTGDERQRTSGKADST
jgi:hypothetical protein